MYMLILSDFQGPGFLPADQKTPIKTSSEKIGAYSVTTA